MKGFGVSIIGVNTLGVNALRLSALAAFALLTGCGYSFEDITVGLGFMAKETCSCAFVVNQTDKFCRAYGDLNAIPVKISINRTARNASAEFLWFWSRFAVDEGPGKGCRLVED